MRLHAVATVGFVSCILASSATEFAFAQADGAAELHLCRNANNAQDKISYCSMVLTDSRNRVALEVAHNTLGHAFMEIQRFADAAQQFTEVIRLNSKIAGYYDNRQNAYRKSQQFQLAMADANSAIKLAPSYAFVYRGRANVFNDMGNFTEAIEDYTRAIQIDPLDGGLFIDRGKIFRSAQLYVQAIADFSHALQIDSRWVGAYRERGLTYKQMGQFVPARADLETYSALSPQDQEAQAALAELGPSQRPPSDNPSPRLLTSPGAVPSAPHTAIPMEKDGGTYAVPVSINNQITLKFIVDSGAADVSIPSDVVTTLRRTGTVTEGDFLGSQTYVLADGSQVPSERFLIRSLKVGDLVLENVEAGISPEKGSLLLGQSFLGRFSSWSIDNNQHALVLNSNSTAQVTPSIAPNANNLTKSKQDYQSTYFISGMLMRSSSVCGGDWQETVDVSTSLLATPELKAVASGYPESTKQWMSDGAENFNTGVMTTGISATCQYALRIRSEAEGMITNRKN